jgi:hypothetical protein
VRCDRVQGYLFSRPMPVVAASAFLAKAGGGERPARSAPAGTASIEEVRA